LVARAAVALSFAKTRSQDTFQVLYVFVVLLHRRRQVIHCTMIDSTAAWTAQIVETFPGSAPRYSSAIATASTAASFADG
jgi:hypothetical protein